MLYHAIPCACAAGCYITFRQPGPIFCRRRKPPTTGRLPRERIFPPWGTPDPELWLRGNHGRRLKVLYVSASKARDRQSTLHRIFESWPAHWRIAVPRPPDRDASLGGREKVITHPGWKFAVHESLEVAKSLTSTRCFARYGP